MKTNVNRIPAFCSLPRRFKDNGKLITCSIDNFPCDNPAYVKEDGFRCNDVSLLDRLSFAHSYDEDLAKIVAARVKENSVEPVSNLSEAGLVATLRPSWCQTASEVKDWEERVYQYVYSTTDIDEKDVKPDLDAQKAEVSADHSSDESKTSE